jgi:hypothetical protein
MAPSASANESLTEDTLSSKPCDKTSIKGTDSAYVFQLANKHEKKGK